MRKDLSIVLATSRRRRSLPPPEVRRFLREQAGATQGELATVLGVTRPSISRYESGARTPRGAILDRYLKVLRRLLEEVGEPASGRRGR